MRNRDLNQFISGLKSEMISLLCFQCMSHINWHIFWRFMWCSWRNREVPSHLSHWQWHKCTLNNHKGRRNQEKALKKHKHKLFSFLWVQLDRLVKASGMAHLHTRCPSLGNDQLISSGTKHNNRIGQTRCAQSSPDWLTCDLRQHYPCKLKLKLLRAVHSNSIKI